MRHEVFKPIPGYDGVYEISNHGTIIKHSTDRYGKPVKIVINGNSNVGTFRRVRLFGGRFGVRGASDMGRKGYYAVQILVGFIHLTPPPGNIFLYRLQAKPGYSIATECADELHWVLRSNHPKAISAPKSGRSSRLAKKILNLLDKGNSIESIEDLVKTA